MKKAIFIIIVILVLALAGWFFFIRLTKEKAVEILYKANTARSKAELSAMGEEFLIAWAKGVRSNNETFTHEGTIYNSGTGRHG